MSLKMAHSPSHQNWQSLLVDLRGSSTFIEKKRDHIFYPFFLTNFAAICSV